MKEPSIIEVLHAFAQYFESDVPYNDMHTLNYRHLKYVHILPKRLTVKPRSQLFHARSIEHTSPTKKFTKSGILSCARYRGVESFKSCDDKASFLIPIIIEPETLVYSAKKIYQECVNHGVNNPGYGRLESIIRNRIATEDEHIIKFDECLIPPEFRGIFKTSKV